MNHRDLRPYVEPKQEQAKPTPAVGSAEWAEDMGRAGKKIVGNAFNPKSESLQCIELRDDGEWYRSDGTLFSWGSKVWSIYEEPAKNGAPPWQPTIRLPTDPTEAAIRVIEYRIAKVRKESSDKICALETTIEELRKGWKP